MMKTDSSKLTKHSRRLSNKLKSSYLDYTGLRPRISSLPSTLLGTGVVRISLEGLWIPAFAGMTNKKAPLRGALIRLRRINPHEADKYQETVKPCNERPDSGQRPQILSTKLEILDKSKGPKSKIYFVSYDD